MSDLIQQPGLDANSLFRKQFLLSKNQRNDLHWNCIEIAGHFLYYHPELEVEKVATGNLEIVLLGFLFDFRDPSLSNLQILERLANTKSFNDLVVELGWYSGHFALIYHTGDRLILLNDACAQYEIYYAENFSAFGSQPRLLVNKDILTRHDDPLASAFYDSPVFKRRKIFIGETTPYKGIRHLRANHYLDISTRTIHRYYPYLNHQTVSMEKATELVYKMFTGYLRAASLRKKTFVGVTGGYDSRILFLASLPMECEYYVTRLPDMNFNHPDLLIPMKLGRLVGKEVRVIEENTTLDENARRVLEDSIDYPSKENFPGEQFPGTIIINGNISEISRHRNNIFTRISANELAFLYGYHRDPFVTREFASWLKNSSEKILKFGYQLTDFFYWEEKMGNWAAKEKTEMNVFDVTVYSPFCSHRLLDLLLSVPIKFRDPINNRFYDAIIARFNPDAAKLPINPSRKRTIKKVLKKFGVYNWYLYAGLKLRLIGKYST